MTEPVAQGAPQGSPALSTSVVATKLGDEFNIVPATPNSPVAGPSGDPQDAGNYLGDYKTREDAERALTETKRAFHEKSSELARMREQLTAVQQTQTPSPAPVAPASAKPTLDELNERLRPSLQENPVGTIADIAKNVAENVANAEKQKNSRTMQEFQRFANDPRFKDVAPMVMQNLPFRDNPNVAFEFMAAKNAVLEHQLKNQAGVTTTPPAEFHVEQPGNSSSAGSAVTIEVPDEALRIKNAFGLNDAQFAELQRNTALANINGQTGKKQVSIVDYHNTRGVK